MLRFGVLRRLATLCLFVCGSGSWGCDSDSNGVARVQALDIATGTTKWTHDFQGSEAHAYPVEGEPHQVMILSSDRCWPERFASFAELDGGKLLAERLPAEIPNPTKDTCAETLIRDTEGTPTLCVHIDTSRHGCTAYARSSGVRLWTVPEGECALVDGEVVLRTATNLSLLDAESGTAVFTIEAPFWPVGIAQGALIAIGEGMLHAINLESGAQVWSRETDFNGLTVVGNRVVVTGKVSDSPCHNYD